MQSPARAQGTTAETKAPARSGGRDRLITAMRGLAMFAVTIVHIPLSYVSADGRSFLGIDAKYKVLWVSWIFAWVLSAFFAASGALSRTAGKRTTWRRYWWDRGWRLLLPYYVFAAVNLPLRFVVKAAAPEGMCGGWSLKHAVTWIVPGHPDCFGLPLGPQWFVMVLIPLVLAAPLMVRVYESRLRHVAFFGAVAVVLFMDVFRYSGAVALDLGNVTNYQKQQPLALLWLVGQLFLVWGTFFYAGFYYADGVVDRMRAKLLPLAGGLIALTVLLVAFGPWPLRMVGGAVRRNPGNQFPPTFAWLTANFAALLLCVRFRDVIERFTLRDRVKPVVDWFAERSYTVYLWHIMAFVAVYWAVRAGGLLPSVESVPALITQILWWLVTLAVLFPIVQLFYPLERVKVLYPGDWGSGHGPATGGTSRAAR